MIFIDNRQDLINVTDELQNTVNKVIEHTLKVEGVDVEYEVSVIFVDNKSIRELNREFRSIDRETDVLSFPMLEYPYGKVYKEVYTGYAFSKAEMPEGRLVLGDMALSLERAEEQRQEYGHSFEREVAYLTVHSMLHLLGYDHEEEEQKSSMRKREEEILTNFNITR